MCLLLSGGDGGEWNRRWNLARLAVASANDDLVLNVDEVVDVVVAHRAHLPDEVHRLRLDLEVLQQSVELVLRPQDGFSQ
jgi:hypothetical protein